jgi:hypothetical protein
MITILMRWKASNHGHSNIGIFGSNTAKDTDLYISALFYLCCRVSVKALQQADSPSKMNKDFFRINSESK